MMKTNSSKHGRAGMTVIELMMVVLIIAILIAFVVALTSAAGSKGDRARGLSDIEQISKALEEYRVKNGEYYPDVDFPGPLSYPSPDNYSTFIGRSGGGLRSYGLATNVFLDPWGRHYRYVRDPNAKFTFKLWSVGPDGKDGTGDELNPAAGQF